MLSVNAQDVYANLPKCAACSNEIVSDNFYDFQNKHYHVMCFKCHCCNAYPSPGSAKERKKKILCAKCYAEKYWFDCDVCREKMDPKFSLQFNDRFVHFHCYKCSQCKQTMDPAEEQFLIKKETSVVFCSEECIENYRASKKTEKS